MTVNGIPPLPPTVAAPAAMAAPPARPPAAPDPAAPATGTATPAAAPEAPAGVNPELWSVLTAAEQAFFVNQTAMGPLTYGPTPAAPAADAAPRGQRIDVRA